MASSTKRGNIWTVTLKIEDSADLAAYIADPNDGWPLVEDEAVMLRAARTHFMGASIALPNGGNANVVDLEVATPDSDEFLEFLTERKFRNQVEGERTATILRLEIPQDARVALEMVLSAWEYLWRSTIRDLGTRAALTCSETSGARAELQEAAWGIQHAAGIAREEAQDLEVQTTIKWTERARLGMLGSRE